MTNEKRVVDYRELRKMFDEQYRKTAELIDNGETYLDNLAEGFFEADMVIRRLPAVDAVEVVRCKDCKHYEKDCGYCSQMGFTCSEDDFCSYGERKTE